MNIHPTAIISPEANIDSSVNIGPYSIIEANVTIGAHCTISSNARIYAGTEMGQHNRVDHGAVIGCEPQDLSYDSSILTKTIIGDHNVFREGANVSRGSSAEKSTIIGNHNYFMATFHVGHDCVLGDHNILTHGTVLAGHVLVGNNAFISGVAAIHQFCQMGDYSMTAGCSKIVKDVPPYAVADGNPATLIGINNVGLKRAGFTPKQRKAIKHAYNVIYKQSNSLEDALEQLSVDAISEVQNIIDFYRRSQRGVTTHR
ncbi:MAG: acyl-ACP--UDP-N-acetylglucosamine O-acyltransferase [Methylococcales bacterium]|jgi:UDP-N-acetylglucosamine acyltransferase|nr:acyl-ACP--UDP-N-acetylglucosamine O-acyltransferase [Methylococcales bacterium]MBT7444223.1 acyl-ACP--UDP-N-acetylglucosamine O-acyltransferase [Methylococcales bacterium]